MDLKAASAQNYRIDVLTRTLMAVCFLATGSILIAALAFDQMHHDNSIRSFSIASKFFLK
ncbi:MAG: hypothetical protein EKK30_07780 [Hyphomicrobium sp.]|jgi:hypothetical protein|nr:MAG: hypothetical protein EKK30_07780 [Hyphomicrobium sp.]